MYQRVTITLTPNTLDLLDQVINEHGFASRSECIRHLIRTYANDEQAFVQKKSVLSFGIPLESIRRAEQEILKNEN